MSYILEVEEDDNGEQFLTFPEDLLEEMGWREGDILNWDVQGEGIVLTKVNDPSRYELEEDE
jgi:bifunctional DNA-binding transcriptional regulator/antitoxin component of YhaV-PrlF toxin-antitoxin module